MPSIEETYRARVGSLLYIADCTRPDISFAVSVLSRFVFNPGHWQRHLESVNHVFQYLYQTVDLHPEYSPRTIADFPIGENQLSGYVNSDRAGCPHNRRSTSGCERRKGRPMRGE